MCANFPDVHPGVGDPWKGGVGSAKGATLPWMDLWVLEVPLYGHRGEELGEAGAAPPAELWGAPRAPSPPLPSHTLPEVTQVGGVDTPGVQILPEMQQPRPCLPCLSPDITYFLLVRGLLGAVTTGLWPC